MSDKGKNESKTVNDSANKGAELLHEIPVRTDINVGDVHWNNGDK